MFFIIGTGRCGTTSLADLFSQSSNCICPHEPEPRLIAEVTQYLYGDLPQIELEKLLLKTRGRKIQGKQYGEASNVLSGAIPAIVSAFSDAKFIWLIRDGRDTVSSMKKLNWYSPMRTDMWNSWRYRADRLGLMTSFEWNRMTSFEKCCWNWSYKNNLIQTELKKLARLICRYGLKI